MESEIFDEVQAQMIYVHINADYYNHHFYTGHFIKIVKVLVLTSYVRSYATNKFYVNI